MKILAVIPARLQSSRFSHKVLFPLRDRPLLYYVWREVAKTKCIDQTIIATDSREVVTAAEQFGAEVELTARKHRTGSDRAAEIAKRHQADIIVNIQADNLGLKAPGLNRAINAFRADRGTPVGTLVRRLINNRDLSDPDVVKAVVNRDNQALWFSRSVLPWVRGMRGKPRADQFPYWYHIGIYLFRRSALEQFARWRRSPYEKAESLEQLRILEHGGQIRAYKTRMQTVSVDSPKDLKKLAKIVR
ncbi:3-deoxy-manno-octulosonate cytidylyltransferase [candidate division GN15 bacterium]|nr:3-deoxy-manno-octulosonate cytidylyltransferase [candidate division GN15 bacterium]